MTLALSLLLIAGFADSVTVGTLPADDASRAMEKFLERAPTVHSYRAVRRLEATGAGHNGWLHAQTEFTPASGFRFVVTAEGGSGYVRSRVLRSLLEEERQLIASGRTGTVAISRANYGFTPEGVEAYGLASVGLQPLRKERSLIIGRLFLTPEDGELVRVEGRLARTPSFWVTRVNIVRSYRRLSGVVVPVSLESMAQLRFFGRSTLRMTYQYSEIDERAVDNQGGK